MGVKKKTFDKLKNFRAGVEGNISELIRVMLSAIRLSVIAPSINVNEFFVLAIDTAIAVDSYLSYPTDKN